MLVCDLHDELVTTSQCLARLRQTTIGRLVLALNGVPRAVPVPYWLSEEQSGDVRVILRCSDDEALVSAVGAAEVGFAVDDYDGESNRGWDISIVGAARVVEDAAEISRLESQRPDTWVGAHGYRYVIIEVERVSGHHVRWAS